MDREHRKLFPGARAWYIVILPIDMKHEKSKFRKWEELLLRHVDKGAYYSEQFLKNLSQVISESGIDVEMRKALGLIKEAVVAEEGEVVVASPKKAKVVVAENITSGDGLGIAYNEEQGIHSEVITRPLAPTPRAEDIESSVALEDRHFV
jgi:hypothetical protein